MSNSFLVAQDAHLFSTCYKSQSNLKRGTRYSFHTDYVLQAAPYQEQTEADLSEYEVMSSNESYQNVDLNA